MCYRLRVLCGRRIELFYPFGATGFAWLSMNETYDSLHQKFLSGAMVQLCVILIWSIMVCSQRAGSEVYMKEIVENREWHRAIKMNAFTLFLTKFANYINQMKTCFWFLNKQFAVQQFLALPVMQNLQFSCTFGCNCGPQRTIVGTIFAQSDDKKLKPERIFSFSYWLLVFVGMDIVRNCKVNFPLLKKYIDECSLRRKITRNSLLKADDLSKETTSEKWNSV